MTKTQANKILNDTDCKDFVLKIFELLNGESYSDAVKIIDAVKYFLAEHSYVDKELAKDLIESSVDNE